MDCSVCILQGKEIAALKRMSNNTNIAQTKILGSRENCFRNRKQFSMVVSTST